MWVLLLVIMPATMAQSQPAPVVAEGIHRDAEGPVDLCGITAPNVTTLEQKVIGDRRFVEENSTELYRVFNREADLVQFVFPRRTTLSFPMATCRKVTANPDGTSTMSREMRCEGGRQECDRVFLEFEALDRQVAQ